MGWFILLGIILAVCTPAAFLINKHFYSDFAQVSVGVTGAIAVVALSFMLVLPFTLINKQADFDEIITEYNYTKDVIESAQFGNYGNEGELMGKVLDINQKIARHKSHANNWWDGAWFSEEVGNLEPLVLTRKQAE